MTLQNITLVALAVLPGLFLTNYVYQHDSVDSEPVGLLWSLVALGALCALPASFLESIGEPIVRSLLRANTPRYYMADSFLVVAVAEEGCKFVVLRLRTWNHRAFDHRFDGIVYCTMVAVGFATLENILYVLGNGYGTGVARALLSVPGHVAWGVIMGYYYGRAKAFEVARDSRQSRRNLVRALIIPIMFHGVYDTCAFISGSLFVVLICIALIGDALMVFLVRRESKNDAAFWRPIGQAGFSGYATYQAKGPVPATFGQASPAPMAPIQDLRSTFDSRSGYQQTIPQYSTSQRAGYGQAPVQAPPTPPVAPGYGGTTAASQSAPAYNQPAPAYSQSTPVYGQPASAYGQPAPTYGQAVPAYGQPVGKPFSWLKFLATRIGGYIGTGIGLIVVAVIIPTNAGGGVIYDFLVYLLALMIIGFLPYVVIMLFAGGMKKRRLMRQFA